MKFSAFQLVLVLLAAAIPDSSSAADSTNDAPVSASKPAYPATVGNYWLTDLDSATATARAKQLPVFVVFVGSDWCPFCKELDKNVFSRNEWKAYVEQRLVCVAVDLPKDKTLLPEEVFERNRKLAERYKVEGFPVCILLDPEDTKEVGRIGMTRNVEVFNFMRTVGDALRASDKESQRVRNTLGGPEADRYRELLAEKKKAELELRDWLYSNPAKNPQNDRLYEAMSASVARAGDLLGAIDLNKSISVFADTNSVRQKAVLDRSREFAKRLKELDSARMNIENWLLAKPEATPANRKIFESLSSRVETALKNVESMKP